MDPITHVAAGVLIGQAARDRFPAGRGFLPLAALAAWLPDVDNIVTFFGAEAYMRYHRGYTHTLLLAPLFAGLLALVGARLWPGASRAKLFLLYLACVLSHLFLDAITTYGTMLFLPFSDVRVAVPSVYIIDPLFTLSLIALAVAGWRRPKARKSFAVAGLALMLAWPALGYGIGRLTEARAEKLLAARGIAAEAVHVQPDAFSPLWWKIIARDGDQYVLSGLDWLHPDTLVPERRYARADVAELNRLGRQAPVFSEYVWFADYPVRMVEQAPQGARVTFADLRFIAVNPLVESLRGSAIPFTLAADLDPTGRLTRALFSQLGKAEVILPSGLGR